MTNSKLVEKFKCVVSGSNNINIRFMKKLTLDLTWIRNGSSASLVTSVSNQNMLCTLAK